MALESLELSYKYMRADEGGYVNDPDDPGGPTNRGVTQRVYDGWRKAQNLAPRSVRYIEDAEVMAIFKSQYWDAVRADELPVGLDYALTDFGWHSGAKTAVSKLQGILGVSVDGVIGNVTMAAIQEADHIQLIEDLCNVRLAYCKKLAKWWKYKNGWTRRIIGDKEGVQGDDVGVIDRGVAMALAKPELPSSVTPSVGRAEGGKNAIATVKDLAKDPKTIGSCAVAATPVVQAAMSAKTENLLIAAFVLCVFGVIGLAAWKEARKNA